MEDDRNEGSSERPRPRVVDKRVATGGAGGETTREEAAEPAAGSAPPEPGPAEGEPSATASGEPSAATSGNEASSAPTGERVWTPEQEAEARRLAQEMGRIPALDWVANSAVTLVNVAATKLDRGDLQEARLAIDALAAIVSGLGDRLGDVHGPLRQTLAQLQMAYSERAASG